MITIIDYGMGNLGAIHNMFRRIGVLSTISSDLTVIGKAQRILLPGVGAFDAAMKRIGETGLHSILDHKAKIEKIPVLGICLGMQLLTRSSEEGQLPGLGWIEAETKRFQAAPDLKVPHMGWNLVEKTQTSPLTAGLPDDARFYFVHSFYVTVDDQKNSILKTSYGLKFDAAIQQDNIFGAQFHPEKSHKFGMQLLSDFAKV